MTKRISLLLMILLVVCGCGTKEIKKKAADIFTQPRSRISVTDESGFTFAIVHRPARIISTMPSNTEILCALGLREMMVGVTTQCNYPPEAKKIQKIGGAVLSTEKIIALNPDLIVMLGDAQKNDIEKFRALQLPVFVINPQTLPDLVRSIRLLGKATGTQKEAGILAKRIQDEVRRISGMSRGKARPKIFVILWDKPLITAGKGTFIDDLINLAGGNNIGAGMNGKYPIMSLETLIEADPDYLIIAGKSKDDIKKVRSIGALKLLKAVKENKILLIDSDIITRPSPRLITALDLITNFIQKQEIK